MNKIAFEALVFLLTREKQRALDAAGQNRAEDLLDELSRVLTAEAQRAMGAAAPGDVPFERES